MERHCNHQSLQLHRKDRTLRSNKSRRAEKLNFTFFVYISNLIKILENIPRENYLCEETYIETILPVRTVLPVTAEDTRYKINMSLIGIR